MTVTIEVRGCLGRVVLETRGGVPGSWQFQGGLSANQVSLHAILIVHAISSVLVGISSRMFHPTNAFQKGF